ncbi:NAD(P)H-dependent oxidoreductase [Inquilinus sp. Marseille-Q2685]|uniref:NAD(P)H-dependent oxidoreductase n=1 Tax=Inquilinus sp. Marseille-Q2685 TaxID=2866581 RepID=UPI001CE3E3A4|nr:NAD(P)H-dependent oxidoreductase [Inquilinus sp. Marseille-Q2685]
MRVLVLFAHPVETSFHAALHQAMVDALRRAGHEVDDCDLYAAGFDPILTREERLQYHDLSANRRPVESHVDRLLRAEALVIMAPVWNFGFPAILKGWFDRVMLPGVSFVMRDGRAYPNLQHIRSLTAVVSYGGTRWASLLMGDPPRKLVRRWLRGLIRPWAPVRYLALYGMNRASDADRNAFLAKVVAAAERL